MWDRDLDKKVERTRLRPLAAGTVTPFNALVFLGAQLSAGLMVLTQFNWYSIALGASSLALVVTYPLMKRVTYWPQAFLGLTFNWGCLLGWSAMLGSCDWSVVLPLYASGVAWTLVYDTIYALQDKKWDLQAGIKSTAILAHNRTHQFLSTFAVSQLGLLTMAGICNGQGPLFYMVSVGGAAAHLVWQLKTLNEHDPKNAWKKFKANVTLGWIVLAGIVLDILWTRWRQEKKRGGGRK
ncbi:Para-hydroxybenzoate--polyprenyltransferase, mitochondrial precursor (PHB:polyprenyltransferase) [Quaeritorhiza haematococci]|nr:Para-hydroxybenzoate--polyprenyltransferase, mitochondrial precursor (PHB:polyprenyltransferase) [Quaeritorhiza haematococci]